jgi:hypothetical protein
VGASISRRIRGYAAVSDRFRIRFNIRGSLWISLTLRSGYNFNMDENPDSPLIDFDELKQKVSEAIRAVIQEGADELGISYDACVDLLLGEKA